MVLEGVDEINWFTDRPNRAEGSWKPQKLLQRWDKSFITSESNAQTTVEIDGGREILTFEMFKPKMKSGKMMFNIKPISNSGNDKLTGVQDIELSHSSLFIDPATSVVPSCFPNCYEADLRGLDMSGQNLFSNFLKADLSPKGATKTNLSNTILFGAILNGAGLGRANLTGTIWKETTCPDGSMNNGTSPCTPEQLNLA